MRTVTAEIRVCYGDTDQMGVVYYANYLRFFEIARAQWIRENGRSYRDIEAAGCFLPVVEARVRYRAPARYDDLLAVVTTAADVRAASLRFVYEVRRVEAGAPGALLAEGSTHHASTNREGRPTRFPAEVTRLLREAGAA